VKQHQVQPQGDESQRKKRRYQRPDPESRMEKPQAREHHVGNVEAVMQIQEQKGEGVALRLVED